MNLFMTVGSEKGYSIDDILYNWLIWRVLKLAFFFQKSILPVFILASGSVKTTLS